MWRRIGYVVLLTLSNGLVTWVEQSQAPGSLVARARGAGNAGGVNADVPADWAAGRTRPLCPFPSVARYKGHGDTEVAASFMCRDGGDMHHEHDGQKD